MKPPPGLRPRKIRALVLAAGAHPRGAAHLSAASGLVAVGTRFYVVADDEHHLGSFERDRSAPVALHRMFAGRLPDSKKKRKKKKPDLESLVAVPGVRGLPTPALLALGSGSRPNRERGAWIALDAAGLPLGRVRLIDFGPLYAPLRPRFAELNIEGAFFVGGELRLLHRGNGGDPRNACIAFAWQKVLAWLAGQADAPKPRSVRHYALGAVGGVPYGFTDGTALAGGGWAFSAVAEDTDDAYADAPHRGSALGIVGADGRLLSMRRLSTTWKVEGIAASAEEKATRFTFTTDADDPKLASCLLQVRLSAAELTRARAA